MGQFPYLCQKPGGSQRVWVFRLTGPFGGPSFKMVPQFVWAQFRLVKSQSINNRTKPREHCPGLTLNFELCFERASLETSFVCLVWEVSW